MQRHDELPRLLPVALRLDGRRCLVVGGGRVAARKAADLLACGADVTVVALEVRSAMATLDAEHGRLEVRVRAYRAEDLDGMAVVMAATGVQEVDVAVAGDARGRGTLVNSADDPERCDFFLTSVHRSGPVTVSVSSSGASPALARWLRARLAHEVGPEFASVAHLLWECRSTLQAQGLATEGLDWDSLLDGPLVAMVRDGRLADARATIEQWLEAAT